MNYYHQLFAQAVQEVLGIGVAESRGIVKCNCTEIHLDEVKFNNFLLHAGDELGRKVTQEEVERIVGKFFLSYSRRCSPNSIRRLFLVPPKESWRKNGTSKKHRGKRNSY